MESLTFTKFSPTVPYVTLIPHFRCSSLSLFLTFIIPYFSLLIPYLYKVISPPLSSSSFLLHPHTQLLVQNVKTIFFLSTMASLAVTWPSFAGAGPSRPLQERRWINRLNMQWSTLAPNERNRCVAYADRWGPASRPGPGHNVSTEGWVR